MANPQAENGHVDIANDIMDAFTRTRIPGEARQVLDFIIRKTWGWKKKNDVIALSQFVKATGIKKPNIIRALRILYQMKIVIKKDNGTDVTYQFNKDYDQWQPLSKKITNVIEKDNLTLSKKIPTKDTVTKEKKENMCKQVHLHTHLHTFKEFWKIYPKKRNKASAEKKWMKLKPEGKLLERILSDVKRKAGSEEWTKDGRQFVPFPSTYLNNRRWEDEDDTKKGEENRNAFYDSLT